MSGIDIEGDHTAQSTINNRPRELRIVQDVGLKTDRDG